VKVFQPCQHPANRGPNPPHRHLAERTRNWPIGDRRLGASLCGPIVATVANVAASQGWRLIPQRRPIGSRAKPLCGSSCATISREPRLRSVPFPLSAAHPCDNCDIATNSAARGEPPPPIVANVAASRGCISDFAAGLADDPPCA
jgi:hypothetical protein